MFCYENKLVFPIYVSDQKFENLMDLLLVTYENKSYYVYINHFKRFKFHKTKNKNKKTFTRVVCSKECFSSKNCWQSIKKLVWQPVRLEKGTIKFKNYFKQVSVPFRIYADFECNLKSVESYEGSYSKQNIKITFLVNLLTNLLVLVINLISQ